MAIEKGQKVKATYKNGEIFEGVLYEVCIGISKVEPTQASIFIKEEESDDMKYGMVHIFCNDLKNIEVLE